MSEAHELTEYEAAYAIGEKVMEMAERVKVVDSVQPGAQARWDFEVDDVAFDVVITVRRK